jgi:predicted NBD/HSP70 family sugar kinase
MRPLALSDQQLDIIRRAAEPLPPRDRPAFLQRVAALLNGKELGDGAVARAAAEAQRRYRDPLNLDGAEAD